MSSVRRKLLLLLLPVLAGLLCTQLWLTYRELHAAANSAYDRSLLGAIKGIDASISTEGGGLNVALPYRMLEFFELTASGKVFYRVSTEDGLVANGNADLPQPAMPLRDGVPYFFNASYFGEPVRVGSYARLLSRPLYGNRPQRIIIQVAESIDSRTAFTRGLLMQAVSTDALLILVVALVMAISVSFALRPLQRLTDEVKSRAPDDLAPIDAAAVPDEVRPLVDAVNHHIERSNRVARAQRQFLDNASHQLRTPLAVLRTQVDYAEREPELAQVREALNAMRRGVDRAARVVNQLLALARVNNAASLPEPVEVFDLVVLGEEVGRMLLSQARRKLQDFGLTLPAYAVFANGSATLLREAVINLVDNAIRHVPERGHITLAVGAENGEAWIEVADDGPGIAPEERAGLGERFHRGKAARETGSEGAGLGLAIAKAIIERHRGRMEVTDGPAGCGVTLRLVLPQQLKQFPADATSTGGTGRP